VRPIEEKYEVKYVRTTVGCRFCRVCALLLAAVWLAGCGGGRATAPVSGKVTKNGKPFPSVSLTFQPIGGGMASTGLTDANGRYTLKFLYSEDEGAIVATHRVIIRSSRKSNTEDTSSDRADPSARDPIPRRYNDASELTIEVPADGTDSADFDIKMP
jgi:hypothetical protein